MRKSLFILFLAYFLLVNLVCGPALALAKSPETAALPNDPVTGAGGKKIPVGGSVKLDDQGPTIAGSSAVTEEGELRKIENWDNLSKTEQDVAWKRLRKRNLERLEELRKHTVEVSKHDSTLDEFEVPDDRSLEDRYIQAQHHLAAFQGSLDKLKANGEAIPGFDGVEQLLEDPTSAEKHKVDAAELRKKLQELQRNTEQLKKDKGISHHEL